MLILDDVHDTGSSLTAVMHSLDTNLRQRANASLVLHVVCSFNLAR